MRLRMLTPALLLLGACSQSPDGVARIPSDSSGYFRGQLEELQLVSSTKDSLYADLAETTRLIADINTELATVRTDTRAMSAVVNPESPLSASGERAAVLSRVRELTQRVRQSEQNLRTTRQRLSALTQDSDAMRTQLAVFETTITDLNQMLEGQKATIAGLESELGALRQQNVQLATEVEALADTVGELTVEQNTVYYVVGTRQELKDRGIIQETGGGRWLLFTRTGETLIPAPNLTPDGFVEVDRRMISEIPLPDPEKTYQIVSAQNLDYIDASALQNPKDRKIRGHLRINSPENFWAPSKYLIIVQN
ncbi:MAG: hypothetical protein ABR602_01570 [Gemmatimonadales bacterium]